jgi:hypothetical protein
MHDSKTAKTAGIYEERTVDTPCAGDVLQKWTVREHQNHEYAYDREALIVLILLASSYR